MIAVQDRDEHGLDRKLDRKFFASLSRARAGN